MDDRLSRWGVGPRIVAAAVVYATLAGLGTVLWPDASLIRQVPYSVLLIAGVVLLVLGVPMLVTAAIAAMASYNRDQLATTGIFSLTRNPVYSAWIVFILPGLALLSRSWPLLLTPIVAYIVFKMSIRKEDEYLEQRFGQAYEEYRSSVNELIPFPRKS
jgi:protein-S-isoprenylcysteine O-methyltransferase Ste14